MTPTKIVRFFLDQAKIDQPLLESGDANLRASLKLVREIIGTARTCETLLVPEENFTLTQFSILDRLATSRGGSLPQDVLVRAKETGTASSVSTLLTRMEAQGWLKRELTPANRRTMTVTITASGKRRYEDALEKYRQVVETHFQAYAPEHIAALFVTLRTFRRLLENSPETGKNSAEQTPLQTLVTTPPMIVLADSV